MLDTTLERIFLAAHHQVDGDWVVKVDSLRTLGAGGLNLHPIPGLLSVQLYEVLTVWKDINLTRAYRRSHSLFKHHQDRYQPEPLISLTGAIAMVTFHFHFPNTMRPRSVTMSPSRTLLIARASDSEIVIQWAKAHGFLSASPPPESSVSDEQSMAIP